MAADLVALSRGAWDALRSESQPAFDDLEESYRQGLLDRAQNVITLKRVTEEGGVFQTFEQNVIEELNPERFHPLSKQFRPDLFPEPIPKEVKEELIKEDVEELVPHDHDKITDAVVKANTPKKAAAKKAAAKKATPMKKPVKIIKGAAKKK